MPITQTRMIALIRAAQDYEQAFTKAGRVAAQLTLQTASTEVSYEEAFQRLAGLVNLYCLRDPAESSRTIGVEAAHFKREATRNIRNNERAWRRRGLTPPGQRAAQDALLLGEPPQPGTAPRLSPDVAARLRPVAEPAPTGPTPYDKAYEDVPEPPDEGQEPSGGLDLAVGLGVGLDEEED